MVKIVCIAVFRHEGKSKRAVKLAEVEDLSGFSFFSRGKAREFITFGCRTTCERTPLGERVSVGCGYKDFVAHSMVRSDGLSGVAVTDEEYPKDMAYQVLYLILRDVNAKLKDKWKKVKQDSKVSPPFMVKYLKDYQEPTKMDKQGKVLKEIGELKLALKDNLQLLLDRGENLDDLVYKTEDLSELAKDFYTQSKKHNQCCKSW
mmetsp:Transcript_28274/g.39310  ORF Transcript_28274/g.39310 Transcript_28274/m.39310 type:complete len:204 (-) Transcript_28274:18-629(-)|eukprot:CAMPEP_0184503316 /NCGR_PEP_ID=MMETSP0113_2-20130426/51822_1 /TAXON_ID=91329 /ORGANISM="Norrisiella sphaerica, Strain BC52" /LENGTH=203 /DNA_ID=CAMNT_0026892795 /DNA_START=94 /DNA_END=705 /DNA_ORIENTATION=+